MQLSRIWPALQVVAHARNGREAFELFDELHPQVCFLDAHMPGMNGVEVARWIGRRAEVVFVTAYENYAVEAIKQGAIDYLGKPLNEDRLRDTISRLQARLMGSIDAGAREEVATPTEALLDQMAHQLLHRMEPRQWLKWIKASVGNTVRLIPVEQVLYLKSDIKYTVVV